jgi:hypothetical protein
LVAALPAVNPASPFVVTQLRTAAPFETAIVADIAKHETSLDFISTVYFPRNRLSI